MKAIKRNRTKYWVCENNGKIMFPYAEAEKMGVGKREFRNAIDELQNKGFLDIKHKGTHVATGAERLEYLLSPTKDGIFIEPAEGSGQGPETWLSCRPCGCS